MRTGYGRKRAVSRYARAARNRNRIFLLAMGTAVILVFLLTGIRSRAKDDQEVTWYKYYKSVMITSDEGVEDIAVKYADPEHYRNVRAYVQEVSDINHMAAEGSSIPGATPGTTIIVPYYSTTFKQ